MREVKVGKALALRRSFTKLSEYEAAAAEATVASSHCGRNRTLAVDLAGSGPLAGLKRPLGGLNCGDAGLRPLCAGRPGTQHINAASCQRGSVEGLRSSSAGCLGLQRIDFPCCDAGFRPLRAGSLSLQRIYAASCQQCSVKGLRSSSAGCLAGCAAHPSLLRCRFSAIARRQPGHAAHQRGELPAGQR